ncbi:MAG: glycosyltransferase family 4 protein [Phycisphaerae bacterium]|nr:glycosyltransferase family 4 protein [Phycisphaerae bacterium]
MIGVFASDILFALDTHLPIAHFSDATARVLRDTYPAARARGPGAWASIDAMERAALGRADACVLASGRACRSAIEHYGVPPERVALAPLGATIVPDPREPLHPAPPEGRDLRLCIVAADPVRKRTGLAVRCVEALSRMGWRPRLTIIGRDHASIPRSPLAEHLGPLRLSDPADRARHRAVLAESHLMILPSLAEAWGIAPAEAAHFGRPSVVSAAGGLPEVVLHEQTGLVLPVDAGPGDYARAIDGLCRDPARYRRLSRAALDRARAEFTWVRCAERLVDAVTTSVPLAAARRSLA